MAPPPNTCPFGPGLPVPEPDGPLPGPELGVPAGLLGFDDPEESEPELPCPLPGLEEPELSVLAGLLA